MEISSVVIATLAGTIAGGFLFSLPGVGAASFAGILLTCFGTSPRVLAQPETVLVFFTALTVSGAFAAVNPAYFFSAPHSATVFLVAPGQRWRRQGRGLAGALTIGKGCLAGVFLLAVLAPLFLYLYEPLRGWIRGRLFWGPAALILFMIGGEFSRNLKRARRTRRKEGYRPLWAGPLIFLLAGLFGLILFQSRRFPAVTVAGRTYASLVGLFLLPPLIHRMLFPEGFSGDLRTEEDIPSGKGDTFAGLMAGGVGGLLTLLVPGIGAGPGALVAGHLLPRRRERAFLFSQGMVLPLASVGAFLFFFLPARSYSVSNVTRQLTPYLQSNRHLASYIVTIAVILAAGGISYPVFHLTSRLARLVSGKIRPRLLSAAILLFVLAILCFRHGPAHLPILFTGACLGSLPLVFGCRRSNLFAATLLPFLLFTLGWLQPAASFLGLQ